MKLTRHFIWLAPLVSIFGFLSYFLIFSQIPALRDSAALNLVLVAAGFILALLAVILFWKTYSIPAKCLSVANTLIAISCLGMLAFYVFHLSSQMPSAELGEKAEPFSLVAASGETIATDKGRFADKYLLLSFYRGYW